MWIIRFGRCFHSHLNMLQTLHCGPRGKTGSLSSLCCTHYLYELQERKGLKMDMCVVRGVTMSSRLAGAAHWENRQGTSRSWRRRNRHKLRETSAEVEQKVIELLIWDRDVRSRLPALNRPHESGRIKLSLFQSHINSSVQRKLPLSFTCIFTIKYTKIITMLCLLNSKSIQSKLVQLFSRTHMMRCTVFVSSWGNKCE